MTDNKTHTRLPKVDKNRIERYDYSPHPFIMLLYILSVLFLVAVVMCDTLFIWAT